MECHTLTYPGEPDIMNPVKQKKIIKKCAYYGLATLFISENDFDIGIGANQHCTVHGICPST